MKKTGCNIKSRLVKVKNLALGNQYGPTARCNQRNCKCCNIISECEYKTINNKLVKMVPGTCSTYNIIYLVCCKRCTKCYIGRSVRTLKTRIGEHRRAFYHVIQGKQYDEDNDEYSIGMHLAHEHNFNSNSDFNENIEVCIIDRCSPKILEVRENKFIHLLQTLRPMGMNSVNPFGLSIINPTFR